MRVSVVIPTYNSGPLVVEAVASVLAQTRPAAEIVVVDDGSTDDTAARLAAFGPAVRYVRKDNGGVSTARNRGVAEATGDWIAFLDADDVWHPRKLEVQCAALARRPDLCLLGTGTYRWPGAHPDPGAEPVVHAVRFDSLVVRNCLVTSTVLARAETLRAAGPFDVALCGPEDHDMWIRVAQRAPTANLSVALTGYRLATPNSLSKNTDRMEAGMRVILEKLERNGVFRGQPLLRRRAWSYFRFSCGAMRYWAGEPGAAIRHLVRSVVGYPFSPITPGQPRKYTFARLKLIAMAVLVGVRGTRRTAAEIWGGR
ncbi:GT2 family glycosyltransferase [Frigoriglobus tundricola]|uniref:GT2 family glycosyltransferase n=1 Tax=Frigoriglobus tundricola TaxID=2774151 RepID=A0A6M5YXW2_9BACT|nr:GT2 family glycosyltransferase [Frigoriglobus tundricola]